MYHDHARAGSRVGEPAPWPTVDAEIHEITDPGETLRSYGFSLVCDHCGDEEECVAAIVTLCSEPPERFTLCGLCYRELCELALGEVS